MTSLSRISGLSAAALVLTLIATANVSGAPRPQVCGGIADPPCGSGTFCQRAAGKCGGADTRGQCVRIPQSCHKIFRPVCGCDNKTYSNDCVRQAARVSKQHNGRCRTY